MIGWKAEGGARPSFGEDAGSGRAWMGNFFSRAGIVPALEKMVSDSCITPEWKSRIKVGWLISAQYTKIAAEEYCHDINEVKGYMCQQMYMNLPGVLAPKEVWEGCMFLVSFLYWFQ